MADSVRKAVSKNITMYRIQSGLSKTQLAERARMKLRFVTYLEREEPNATLEVLERIASALGVSVADLVRVSDEGEPTPSPKIIEIVLESLKSSVELLEQSLKSKRRK